MLRLTRRAMAQFTIQRLASTELILDLAAVTIRLVLHIKVLILLVYTVRRALLPLRNARRLLATVLIFGHSDSRCGECVSREVRGE
jgi:hypothetical protein